MNDISTRIPIRLALGGMYTKQDLTALICSALSGRETGIYVPNFSFSIFLEMSKMGRLLLILDGFDEMRHAMDLDDFIFTFEQMQPLFSGQAKVIILWRPESFLSNTEEERVLSALFDIGVNWEKKIQRVEVAFFSKSEVIHYLDTYVSQRHISLSETELERYKSIRKLMPDSDDNILS